MSNAIPAAYKPQTSETLPDYLAIKLPAAIKLGWTPDQWQVTEVGDGNLNMVFIVKGLAKTIVVKQALPWLMENNSNAGPLNNFRLFPITGAMK